MSLAKYDAFLKVVRLGSLTKAAEQIGCTQSCVSHMIGSLESEFGFPLLIRNRWGVRLTSAGEQMRPYMEKVLEDDARLYLVAESIRGMDTGVIRIGAFTSVAVHWLPGMIKRFQADFPKVEFKLFSGDYHDIDKWLERGDIDIGFISITGDEPWPVTPLVEDRLLAILPKDHPLAGRGVLKLRELEKEPFITILESSNHDVQNALEHAGVKPEVKFETKDDYAVISMVESGLGVSIMPELVLEGRCGSVSVAELENRPKRIIGIATPSSAPMSPASKSFAEYVVKWVEQHYGRRRD